MMCCLVMTSSFASADGTRHTAHGIRYTAHGIRHTAYGVFVSPHIILPTACQHKMKKINLDFYI